jgi:hypothetical protein
VRKECSLSPDRVDLGGPKIDRLFGRASHAGLAREPGSAAAYGCAELPFDPEPASPVTADRLVEPRHRGELRN